MGTPRPPNIDQDGDDSVLSPGQSQPSLLATETGTNKARRLTTTPDHELRVAITSGGASGGLTNTELRATPVPVSGSVTVLNPTTNPETGLAKDLTLTNGTQKTEVTNFPSSQAVTGPLTDTQLRAVAVPVSGTVSTGGLTDTQLRAVAVPVSGTFFQVTQPVSGTVSSNVNLTYGTPSQAIVGSGAANLVSATSGYREITIKVPGIATNGICLNPNGTATTSHFRLDVGQSITLETAQAVSAIRNGAVDVTVDVLTAV